MPKTYSTIDFRDALRLAKRRRSPAMLADIISLRLHDRFITPLSSIPPQQKSGFLLATVACVVIEAYVAFVLGWDDTRNLSGESFNQFFKMHGARLWGDLEPKLKRAIQEEFYTHVRCPLLHAASTTGHWVVRRSGPRAIFVDPGKNAFVVNANLLLKVVRLCIDELCSDLRKSKWDSEITRMAAKRLTAISTTSFSK